MIRTQDCWVRKQIANHSAIILHLRFFRIDPRLNDKLDQILKVTQNRSFWGERKTPVVRSNSFEHARSKTRHRNWIRPDTRRTTDDGDAGISYFYRPVAIWALIQSKRQRKIWRKQPKKFGRRSSDVGRRTSDVGRRRSDPKNVRPLQFTFSVQKLKIDDEHFSFELKVSSKEKEVLKQAKKLTSSGRFKFFEKLKIWRKEKKKTKIKFVATIETLKCTMIKKHRQTWTGKISVPFKSTAQLTISLAVPLCTFWTYEWGAKVLFAIKYHQQGWRNISILRRPDWGLRLRTEVFIMDGFVSQSWCDRTINILPSFSVTLFIETFQVKNFHAWSPQHIVLHGEWSKIFFTSKLT